MKKKGDATSRKSRAVCVCVDDEARRTAAEKRRAIFLFVASPPPPPFPPLLPLASLLFLPGKRRRGVRGKSPSLVNFRLKFLPFREQKGMRRGAGGVTPSKNKRAPPPKLDFNFRDIINFSRPRARPRACIIAEKKRIRNERNES